MRYKRICKYAVVVLLSVLMTSAFAIRISSFEDVLKNTSAALKKGDAKKLGGLFEESVNLSVKKEGGSFTKFQAELLLHDFFRSNKIIGLKEVQRGNNSSTSFVVFSLKTSSKSYRVFMKFTRSDNDFKIAELRIE